MNWANPPITRKWLENIEVTATRCRGLTDISISDIPNIFRAKYTYTNITAGSIANIVSKNLNCFTIKYFVSVEIHAEVASLNHSWSENL